MATRLLKNGLYNVLAGAIRIGLVVLTTPVIIHLIGIKSYGLWALATALVELVALSGNGLSVTTTVFLSQDLAKDDAEQMSKTLTVMLGGTLVLATLAAVSLWLGTGTIVKCFPQLETIQRATFIEALPIGGLIIWARLLQQVLIGIQQAYQRYGLLNILNTLQWVLLSLGLAIVAYFGGRTVELMQWYAATSLVILFGHILVVKTLVDGIRLKPIWDFEKGLQIAYHSLKTWLICLGSVAFGRGDRLIVGSFLGSESIGIYAVITEATSAMSSFSSLPVQPIVPLLSNQSANKNINRSQLKAQIKQICELNGVVTLCCASWLYIFAPFIMNILLTNQVTQTTIVYFRIAVLIYALSSLSAVGFYILLSVSENLCMLLQLASGILALVLITIGAIKFGLLGAVVGNVGFILTWLMIFLGMKQLKLSIYFWLKCLLFPMLSFLICILLSFWTSSNFNLEVSIAVIHTTILVSWFLLKKKRVSA